MSVAVLVLLLGRAVSAPHSSLLAAYLLALQAPLVRLAEGSSTSSPPHNHPAGLLLLCRFGALVDCSSVPSKHIAFLQYEHPDSGLAAMEAVNGVSVRRRAGAARGMQSLCYEQCPHCNSACPPQPQLMLRRRPLPLAHPTACRSPACLTVAPAPSSSSTAAPATSAGT